MPNLANKLGLSPDKADIPIDVKNAVRHYLPKAQIILFGPHATGRAELGLDWNFMVLTEADVEPIDRGLIHDLIHDLEVKHDAVISLFIRTRSEWTSKRFAMLPFKRQIDQEGIYI